MLRRVIQNRMMFSVLATVLMCSCHSNKETNKEKEVLLSVSVTKAEEGLVSDDETFSNILMPIATNNITGQSGVRLDRLYVKIGDRVSKGQVLARMDQSQLNQMKVKLNNAKIDFSRADELYKVGGISKSQWEQAASQRDILQEQYDNLQNNIIVRSPINGVVTAKNYDVGDITSLQMPLLVVQDISTVKMILKISEKYYSLITKDMPVNISVDAIPNKTFSGYVYSVYPTIDERTHSATVEVRVDNKANELRPGMFAKAFIKFGDVKSILVPDNSVMTQLGSGHKIVYLLQNGKAISRDVEVGRIVGDKYQILSGISVGDTVISSQINSLSSGMKVDPILSDK